MELATYIRERRQEKELLIMAHVVCGYPSFEEGFLCGLRKDQFS